MVITDTVTFTASGFTSNYGQPVPTSPVTGSFTITFDPTLMYTDATAGITLNSLNITLGSQLSFDYSPTANVNNLAGQLVVGGTSQGANQIGISPSTNDFYLQINNFAATPVFNAFGYSQTSTGTNSFFYTTSPTSGSATVTPVVGGVPEPATWALMIAGFGLVGATVRRRKAIAQYAN